MDIISVRETPRGSRLDHVAAKLGRRATKTVGGERWEGLHHVLQVKPARCARVRERVVGWEVAVAICIGARWCYVGGIKYVGVYQGELKESVNMGHRGTKHLRIERENLHKECKAKGKG